MSEVSINCRMSNKLLSDMHVQRSVTPPFIIKLDRPCCESCQPFIVAAWAYLVRNGEILSDH